MAEGLSRDERLSAAFMAAFAAYPYFASGLALLVRRWAELPSGTMGVTRDGVLLVDPRFVERFGSRQLGEVLVHELQHLVRDHAGRSDLVLLVDRHKWNVAADCEVNSGLQRDLLPGEPCLPESFHFPDGLLAEEYYERLGNLSLSSGGGVAAGECGGGSGGERLDCEPEEGASGSRTEVEVQRMRREVAEAVVRAASRSAGDVPGDLLRWARTKLSPPKVRWQDKIGRALRSNVAAVAGTVDYSRSRICRRQLCYDALARSMGAEAVQVSALVGAVPRVAVLVDTSGSMGEAELSAVMSEVAGVLRVTRSEVTFLVGDCRLSAKPRRVRSVAEAVRGLRGGGGTDFVVILQEVERLRLRPGLLVIMTDGQGPAPVDPPRGMRVIWVLVGRYAKKAAEWGESIFVEEDRYAEE